MTFNVIAYLVALWVLSKRQGQIADALAVNWIVCQMAVMLNGGYGNLPAFLLADFLTALWLALSVQGVSARRASYWFVPMIALNSAAYAAGGNPPVWHHTLLSICAWGQLVATYWGPHGLMEILDNTSSSIRHSISGAVASFRGKK